MKEELQKYYATSDLSLVTTISIHFPLEKLGRENPQRTFFLFIDTPELQKLILQYWKGQILVEPRTYFDSLKAMKARLYSND